MSAILSYLIGHAYDWVVKLIILLIVLNVLALFGDAYLNNLKIVGMWWLNQTYYTMVTYQTASLIEQLIIFIITFNFAMWVFGYHHSPHSHAVHGKK